LPIFARDILMVGPEGLGLLNAAVSSGAGVGGALLAGGRIPRPLQVMLVGLALRGVFLLLFGLSPTFVVSLLMLFGMGFANVVAEVCRLTIILSVTPDAVRGRVLSLGLMFTGGGPPTGQLASGALATGFGPIPTAVIGGLGAVLCVLLFSRLASFRGAGTVTLGAESSGSQGSRAGS
jgi:hypothetical protein